MNLEIQDFVLHDFRHSAPTHLHAIGQPSDVIEKTLAQDIATVGWFCRRADQ